MSELRSFIVRAYQEAPAVRAQFDDAGVDPGTIVETGDLARVPVLRKGVLAERQKADRPFGGFLTVPPSDVQRIFASPGPIYDPQGKNPDYWRWGAALEAAGFAPGDIVQNTFSYHLTPAGMMFDSALRALGCTVVPAGVGNSEIQITVMRDLGVTGYIGVPSFLYTLLKKAEEMGCRGDLKLTRAWVAAEKLSEELRVRFREQYGVEVYQGYGTADLGCVGYECSERRGFHLAPGVIVEILDPETGSVLPDGEAGEVVVTVMEPLYPLVRFGTGDLGIMLTDSCPCGRPARRLAGIFGRTADGVKVRGLFLYPHQIEELERRIPEIRFCQAVVTTSDFRDVLTLKVQTHDGIHGETLKGKVAFEAKACFRLTSAVEIVAADFFGDDKKKVVDLRSWE
ncbi:MAG: AMP-binding protein [Clostridia bacterium]|nr:AMP-binding protein [Clostridia bacterium]MDQ7790883.1 AMP-binding protein [Clostridia bacterium]